MGRFYFYLRAGDELIRDDEGVDLPDFSAAQREATLAARELLAEAIMSGRPKVPDALVIVDEVGRTLDAVALAAVLPEPLKTWGLPSWRH
jgi:stage III sporulation protein SpoIIIAA